MFTGSLKPLGAQQQRERLTAGMSRFQHCTSLLSWVSFTSWTMNALHRWAQEVEQLQSFDYSPEGYKSGSKRKKVSLGPTTCNGELYPIPTEDPEVFDGRTPKRKSWTNARRYFQRCDLCSELDPIVNDEPEKVNIDLLCWTCRASWCLCGNKARTCR